MNEKHQIKKQMLDENPGREKNKPKTGFRTDKKGKEFKGQLNKCLTFRF